MQLIIAEKPDLGRAIAAAIPAPQTYDKNEKLIKTTLHGQETIIIWCFGHLLELLDPEDYGEQYGKWSMETIPFYFPDWKHKPRVDKKTGETMEARVNQIGKLLKQASVVINAGDIDEEGQLLVDELLRYHNYTGRTLRLNTNDTSKEAMARALEKMESNDGHVSAGLSAFGRQLSDSVFGFNLTRYFTLVNGSHVVLPVGRVKLPTLGLVVRRDRLIEGHQKVLFYTLDVPVDINGHTINARYVPSKDNPHLEDGHILDRSYIDKIQKSLAGHPLSPITITKSIKKETPPLPFNQVKLFAFCAKRWDLQPNRVAKITQDLRDKHRAITYNRSDCQYLSEDTFEEAPTTLPIICDNMGLDPSLFDPKQKSRCFNNANLTAHTAIIPTCSEQNLDSFTEDERKVYDIIARYYLIQFMPQAQREVTKMVTPGPDGGSVEASSSKIVDPGFLSLLKDLEVSEDDETPSEEAPDSDTLLSFSPGQYNGKVGIPVIKEGETKPPARYTQASLIEDMSSIAKYVENVKVKELLLLKDKDKKGENGSIGTPATRERIISDLVNCGFLKEEKKGKRSVLISTDLGREFYDVIPDNIRKVDVSAKWWVEQEQIKTGDLTPDQMARDVLRTVKAVIDSGVGAMPNAVKYAKGGLGGDPIGKCPKCGADVVETKKGFKCMGEGCKFCLWKDDKFFSSFGKAMTASVAKNLLNKGHTKLTGVKSKKDPAKKYDCIIQVDFSEQYPKYTMAFDDKKKGGGGSGRNSSSSVKRSSGSSGGKSASSNRVEETAEKKSYSSSFFD